MDKGWNAAGHLTPLYKKAGGVDRLAELTGIGRTTLSAYNTGTRNLGWANARRIAEAADVSLLDLGAPAEAASRPAVTLADLDELMQAARRNQDQQWALLRQLAGDVKTLAEGIDGLREFVESALRPPDSGRERRLGGL